MTGAELKALRQALGLTQNDMADGMGLTSREYGALETNLSETIRRNHVMAASLVSLEQAIARQDPDLARPRIRELALQYAALPGAR